MIEKMEYFLQDLISGKIKSNLNLHEPDTFEGSESFKEYVQIQLPDDNGISCDFEWGYSRENGMKGDGYLTPDDPDILTLDYFEINSLIFHNGEDEFDVTSNKELSSLMKKYLIGKIGMDEIDPRIYEKDWNRIFGTVKNPMYENKRLMKFDQFVNENSINENKTITAEQMVKNFNVNVEAGWILKSVLIDKESIEGQLIEHFDVTYGIGNIQEENPKEFRKAVNILCKKYLK